MRLLRWLMGNKGEPPADLEKHERQVNAVEADWDKARGEAKRAIKAAKRRPSAMALEVRRRG